MKETIYSIACDFGSSGGKIFLGTYNGNKILLETIHEFSLEPIKINDYYYTNVLYIWSELLTGLKKIIHRGIQPHSLAIDTWGVDFAFINKKGELLSNPINYRTERTLSTDKKLDTLGLTKEYLFERTGISLMPYNSLLQIFEDSQSRGEIINHTDKVLFLPDLFAYWLTGKISTEYCIASTSQLLNIHTMCWDTEILKAINIKKELLPDIQETGSIKAFLSPELAQMLDCKPFPIIAGCSHDTAAAVLSSPLKEQNSLYISSGSWSLMGVEQKTPIISKEALAYGFTNELGYNKTVRFLKSINGLWLIQLLQRQWQISFSDIIELAKESFNKGFLIDVTHNIFFGNSDITKSIITHCQENNFKVPHTRSEIAAAIYEGLGLVHAKFLSELEGIIGENINHLHLVGGGCRDKMFYQSIKKYTERPLTINPIQATAIGNITSQLLGLNILNSIEEARSTIQKSFEVKSI
ncbi:MAG: rhamnulokinase [Brevinema sp.]